MLKQLPLRNVKITDVFWSKSIETARKTSIDYMWKALNDEIPDAPPSGAIHNFKVACGLKEGEFIGFIFQDSDLYKFIEAASYSLETEFDEDLKNRIDTAIELIEKAQCENGYLNTHFTINKKEKWSNTHAAHELYCAGHLFEAAAAHFQATGDKRLVNVSCKFADHIISVFGDAEGKIKSYPGHQEVELGLVKLFELTANKKYLKLAEYFLNERGIQPFYYNEEFENLDKKGESPKKFYKEYGHMPYCYQQAHMPVREQKEAVGHAVRCVYMGSGMADVGARKDETLLSAARELFENIVNTQMYITGGIGSSDQGEAFSFPYDIPNDRAYNESCASIGLLMFAHRLLNSDRDAKYADIMELTLYNTILAGVSQNGTKFFYSNPMEMWPDRSIKREDSKWFFSERQPWFGCACCPPNILRTLLGLGKYIYSVEKDKVFVNLFIASELEFNANGKMVKLKQTGEYPASGRIIFTIEEDCEFSLMLRIPEWCEYPAVWLNSDSIEVEEILEKGYAKIARKFKKGDEIIFVIPIEGRFYYCDGRVPYNSGKVALKRGPQVYCAEGADNGSELWNLFVDPFIPVVEDYVEETNGGTVFISSSGYRQKIENEKLYGLTAPEYEETEIKFVPYYMWGNRGANEMTVWQNVQRQVNTWDMMN